MSLRIHLTFWIILSLYSQHSHYFRQSSYYNYFPWLLFDWLFSLVCYLMLCCLVLVVQFSKCPFVPVNFVCITPDILLHYSVIQNYYTHIYLLLKYCLFTNSPDIIFSFLICLMWLISLVFFVLISHHYILPSEQTVFRSFIHTHYTYILSWNLNL